MLVATKSEIAAVIELMNSPADAKGQPWTEGTMGRALINLVSTMREERKVHALVYMLAPRVHVGFGPYATVDAAFNSVVDNPMSYIAKRAAVVPILGPGKAEEMLSMADEPPAERGDFALAREDGEAFRRGWKGNQRDRAKYLTATT